MGATKRRILCLDDRYSRNLAVFLLERAGYEVTAVSSFKEALELTTNQHFDLHLINDRFGGGSGRELCDKLAKFAAHTPVLFYSSVTYAYREKPEINCGPEGRWVKPVDISEVVPAAAQVIVQRARAASA